MCTTKSSTWRGAPTPGCALALREHALPREEDQDGRHDGQVRQQRVGVAEHAVALALHDDVAHRGEDRVHHADRLGIEMRSAGRDLAQHDGREPGAGAGLLDDGDDPGVELVFGGAGAVGDGAGAGADGAEHVAEHLDVEPELAAVVVVDHRLVDARLRGDAVDAGGVVAALGELAGGGGEDGGLGARGQRRGDALVY